MTSQSSDNCLSAARRVWLVVTLALMAGFVGLVWYQARLFRAGQVEARAHSLLLKDLAFTSPSPMLVVDSRGIVLDANPQALLEFGYTRPELINQPIASLIPRGCRHLHDAGFVEAVEQVRAGRALWNARHAKVTLLGKDGALLKLDMTAYAIPKRDGSLEFHLLFDEYPGLAEKH